MRILDVSARTVFPPRDGSMVRIYHLLRWLSRRHFVRLFSQPRLDELRRRPFEADIVINQSFEEHRSPARLPAALVQLFRRVHASGVGLSLTRPTLLQDWSRWADVTIVEQPWQYRYCRQRDPHGLIVLATHNFEKSTSASNAEAAGVDPRRSFWYRYSAAAESHAVRDSDLVVAVSPEDAQSFITTYGINPDRVVVVPNAADSDHYTPVGPEKKQLLKSELDLPNRTTIVFLASKPSPPHAAAIQWVRRAANALPDFTFLVVGGVLEKSESQGNVLTTGPVEDPCPYLQAADVALCPVEFGGGTKIKTLECAAVGLPIVAFPEAIRGTTLQNQHLVICEPIESDLFTALKELAENPQRGKRLGEAARRLVTDQYDWKTSGQKLEDALVRLVGDGHRVATDRSSRSELSRRQHV